MAKHTDRERRRRRRMKKFRLDEISLVDTPAQAPATIAIMKRADEDIQKVLPSPRSDESKSDFVSRFMGNSEAREEFPDREQRLAVANQKFDSAEKSVNKRMALTSMTDGHAHLIIGVEAHREGLAERRAGQTSFTDGHTHDWVMDDAGNIVIADEDGHTHGISTLIQKNEDGSESFVEPATESKDEPSDSGDPTRRTEGTEAVGKGAVSDGEEGVTMTPEEKAAMDKAVQEKEQLEKRAQRAETIVSLSPEERAYFDGLGSEAKDEFLGKSAEERGQILKNAKDADPVVYTRPDGTELRKSAGDLVIDLAKQADETRKELEKQQAVAKRANFEKRAQDELGHLKGTNVAKADLLEAIESLEDEDKRNAVLEIVKSKDAGMAKAMTRMGNRGSEADGDPQDKILSIAKKLQEQDSSLSSEVAYSKALDTPEGLQAFQELREQASA